MTPWKGLIFVAVMMGFSLLILSYISILNLEQVLAKVQFGVSVSGKP